MVESGKLFLENIVFELGLKTSMEIDLPKEKIPSYEYIPLTLYCVLCDIVSQSPYGMELEFYLLSKVVSITLT